MSGQDYEESAWITKQTGNKYQNKHFQEVFDDLQKSAEEQYGWELSGQIDRAGGFQRCGVMTRKQYNIATNWNDGYGSGKVPSFIEDQGVEEVWKFSNRKDDFACAVVIKDETRDAIITTGKVLKDKGIVPVNDREKAKYEVNYRKPGYSDWYNERFENAPDAWKWIKSEVAKNSQFNVSTIKNSYTYAKPKFEKKKVKGKEIKVMFFGVGDD